MNKSNNNNSRTSRAKPPAVSQPKGPVQGRGRPPRPSGAPRAPYPASGNPGPQRTGYAPAAMATGTASMQPKITGSRNSTRIVHRELVASVSGTAAFTAALTLALNPGLAVSFPWLSSQAQAWEEYRFNRLRFCYYTRTGSNIPGSVQLVPDYDPADAAPASEQIASSFEDVVEDAPWKDLKCVLNPVAMYPMGPKKFIRSGALAANLDIKTYDSGQLFLCTVDGTAVPWGKLWVEYDVSLFVPANSAGGSAAASSQHITSTNPTTANILPVPVTLSGSSPIVSVAGSVLTFLSAGRFFVALNEQGTSTTVTGAPTAAAGGALILTFDSPNGYNNAGNGTSTEGQVVLMDAVVGSTLTFNNTVVTGTSSELFVVRVPSLQA